MFSFGMMRRRAVFVFRPEMYGTPTGSDPAIDMPLVNAAITAASIRGGIVRLTGNYAYTAGGTINLGSYTNTTYGFQVNASNVHVDGGGQLILVGKPTFTNTFVGFLFGNGLYDYEETGHTFPGRDTLLASGNWIYNVSIENITFNNSALSDADLLAMSDSVIGSVLMFSGVDGGEISNITIDRGYGVTGAFHYNALSRNLTHHHNHVEVCYRNLTWFDGLSNSEVYSNTNGTIINTGAAGIVLTPNTDYRQNSQNVYVHDNVVNNAHAPLALSGLDHLIENNIFNTLNTTLSHIGIFINTAANERGLYPCSYCIVRNNQINAASSTVNGFGIELQGAIYLGDIAGVDHLTFQNNVVGANKKFLRSIHIKTYTTFCDFSLNDLYSAILDDGSVTSHDNIITPNTFH